MRVYAFHCGGDQADLAINDPLDENVGTKQYSPYFFYMVEHPRGRVLFDTGLHPEIGTNFAGRMGTAAGAFPIELEEDGDVTGQLRKLGLGVEDIDAVVVSHLHFDHAGGLEFVRHAPVYAQAIELSTARNPPPYQAPYGILGASQLPLSQVYGPGGGGGASAPELNRGKITPGLVARHYVWVQDSCRPLTSGETCRALRDAYDEVETKLQRAFKSDRPPLEQREATLLSQLRGC